MAYPAFSSGIQAYRPDLMRPRTVSRAAPEAMRSRLAAMGMPAQVLRAQSTSMAGEYEQAAPPPGGVQFQLRNWQGPAAQFSGGGKGYRPLAANQGPAPMTPPAFPPSLTSQIRQGSMPAFRPRPGGNANPWNVQQLKNRKIDPYGAKSPYRRR